MTVGDMRPPQELYDLRHASGPSPALLAGCRERYESRPQWGVTRRCLPGGISRRGDWSPEGATGPAGRRRQGIRPSSRARATASVRLAAPSLLGTWVTCFLTVSS